jgi:hypothetical protein
MVKLRVLKPLIPIFRRESGQCQISDNLISDCGLRIADCGFLYRKSEIINPNPDCRLQIKKSEIKNPQSEIIIMKYKPGGYVTISHRV